MSSKIVRNTFDTWIRANIPSESNIIDLTAMYSTIENMLEDAGIGENADWLGLQYIGANEQPLGLAATNTSGCYRETGSFFIHVTARVKASVYDDLLDRCETIRNAIRGENISGIIRVESVSPPNFESGATLQFDGGYQSASIVVNYERDYNL